MIRRVDREIRSNDKRVAETNFRTRPMQPDITAADLRLILIDDLGTGDVDVSAIYNHCTGTVFFFLALSLDKVSDLLNCLHS